MCKKKKKKITVISLFILKIFLILLNIIIFNIKTPMFNYYLGIVMNLTS